MESSERVALNLKTCSNFFTFIAFRPFDICGRYMPMATVLALLILSAMACWFAAKSQSLRRTVGWAGCSYLQPTSFTPPS